MKKLIKTRELVEKLKGQISKLREHGFSRVPVLRNGRDCSISAIYVNRKKKIVVKRPYITEINRREDIKPAFSVPTEIIKCPTNRKTSHYAEFDYIFIQPLVDIRPDSQAHARSILEEKDADFADLKTDNCGLYKRQPVIFDW